MTPRQTTITLFAVAGVLFLGALVAEYGVPWRHVVSGLIEVVCCLPVIAAVYCLIRIWCDECTP